MMTDVEPMKAVRRSCSVLFVIVHAFAAGQETPQGSLGARLLTARLYAGGAQPPSWLDGGAARTKPCACCAPPRCMAWTWPATTPTASRAGSTMSWTHGRPRARTRPQHGDAAVPERSACRPGSVRLPPDMRTLLVSTAASAREAVDVFVYRIARELGSVAAGGIGAHAAEIRARVCPQAAWFGVRIDADENAAGGPRLHAQDSAVAVWALPADEEAVTARATRAVADGYGAQPS